jgi:hypothetical protein
VPSGFFPSGSPLPSPCVLHALPISPSLSWSLGHYNYSWRTVQVAKLLVMQFSPTSYHFIPVWYKYSPQHPVLKHPQSTFLPYCQRPSFTPIQNHRQNYSYGSPAQKCTLVRRMQNKTAGDRQQTPFFLLNK